MPWKTAGTVLIVFTLAVVFANQNDAEDTPAETGNTATIDATLAPAGIGDHKAESLQEAERMKESLNTMKAQVATRLREFQGLPAGFSDIVVSANEGEPDQSISLSFPQMSRKHLPPRISLEEEEWMLLASELHAENCVELLLNRILDSPQELHVSMKPWRQGPPAFYFLCKIGKPACRAALNRIPLESDVKIRRRLTLLLQNCLGNTLTKVCLQQRKEACDTAEKQQRVQVALEQCEEIPLPRGVAE